MLSACPTPVREWQTLVSGIHRRTGAKVGLDAFAKAKTHLR